MNSIVKKVLVVLAVVFGLYTVVLYSFGRFVVRPSFDSLQRSAAIEEVGRCNLILNKEVAIVRSLCKDWATWDDAYAFVADRNEEFIKSNMDYHALRSSRINTVVFMDNRGTIVWGKTYDFDTGNEIHVPQFSQEQVVRTPLLYSHDSIDSIRSGLLLIDGRPVIVCASRIVNTRCDGPIRGSLLMARFLSRDDISSLAESLGTDFRLMPLQEANQTTADMDYAIAKHGRNSITIMKAVNDMLGEPTMAIVATLPTPIAAKGHMVGWFVSLSIITVGAITLVVTFVLLKRVILRRLEVLGDAIAQAGIDDAGPEAENRRGDELGKHVERVTRMLDHIDSTEHALTASYQRFRIAFMNAPFPIMIHDESGKVLQLNNKWTELTGYSRADIPTVDAWCAKACGRECDELRKAMQTAACCDSSQDVVDYAITTSNGDVLTWSFSSSSLGAPQNGRQQIISMGVDVTERHKAQQTLRDNESLFRSLTESIPAVSYLAELTSDAPITYVSPQTHDFFGYRPEDLRSSADPWRLIISRDDYGRIMDQRFAAVSERRHFMGEYNARSRDGQMRLVREEAQIVSTAKGPMIQGVIFDVTGTMAHEVRPVMRHAGN